MNFEELQEELAKLGYTLTKVRSGGFLGTDEYTITDVATGEEVLIQNPERTGLGDLEDVQAAFFALQAQAGQAENLADLQEGFGNLGYTLTPSGDNFEVRWATGRSVVGSIQEARNLYFAALAQSNRPEVQTGLPDVIFDPVTQKYWRQFGNNWEEVELPEAEVGYASQAEAQAAAQEAGGGLLADWDYKTQRWVLNTPEESLGFDTRDEAVAATELNPGTMPYFDAGTQRWILINPEDAPQIPSSTVLDQQISEALTTGNIDEAQRLSDLKLQLDPYWQAEQRIAQQQEATRAGEARQAELVRRQESQRDFDLRFWQAQETQRQNALDQQLAIQRSPGDWWLYMNQLRAQQQQGFGPGGVPRPGEVMGFAQPTPLPGSLAPGAPPLAGSIPSFVPGANYDPARQALLNPLNPGRLNIPSPEELAKRQAETMFSNSLPGFGTFFGEGAGPISEEQRRELDEIERSRGRTPASRFV